MTKSLLTVSGIAALLLFQQHSAAHAQTKRPIRLDYSVTKTGWMNLRKIDSSFQSMDDRLWYACGQRKVIAFWPTRNPKDEQKNWEVLGKQPNSDTEFFGTERVVWDLVDWIADAKEIPSFMATASAACAAPANSEPPPWMNISVTPKGQFFYLMPRDFLVNGPNRTFWANGHPARKVTQRSRVGEDGKPLYPYGGGDFEAWVVKYKREVISRVEINCNSGQIRTLFELSYDASDNVIDRITEPTKPSFIVPDTVGDAWREVVCLIK